MHVQNEIYMNNHKHTVNLNNKLPYTYIHISVRVLAIKEVEKNNNVNLIILN